MIEQHRAHRDQAIVFDRRAVHNRAMSDGDAFADRRPVFALAVEERDPPVPEVVRRVQSSAAATNSVAFFASSTMSLHCRTTSFTGVEMIGRAVAMYSRPLVGLMYCVLTLLAKAC